MAHHPDKRLFVTRGNREIGPFAFEDAMKRVRAGELSLDDSARIDGSHERALLRVVLPKLGPPLPQLIGTAHLRRSPAVIVRSTSAPSSLPSSTKGSEASQASRAGSSAAPPTPAAAATTTDSAAGAKHIGAEFAAAKQQQAVGTIETPFVETPVKSTTACNSTHVQPVQLTTAARTQVDCSAARTSPSVVDLANKVVIREDPSQLQPRNLPRPVYVASGWVLAAACGSLVTFLLIVATTRRDAKTSMPNKQPLPGISPATAPFELTAQPKPSPPIAPQISPPAAPSTISSDHEPAASSPSSTTPSEAEIAATSPQAAVNQSVMPLVGDPAPALAGERFPQTRQREMGAWELRTWSAEQIQYAINEMYARRGAEFRDSPLKQLFSQFSWYHPQRGMTYDNAEKYFTAVEAQNVKLLGFFRDARRAGVAPDAPPPGRTNTVYPARPVSSSPEHPRGPDSRILVAPQPNYPPEARRKKITGSGRFKIKFKSDGSVQAVRTVDTTGNVTLDSAAITALLQWRAVPGTQSVTVPVTFKHP